jgi:DNA methylase
MDWLTMFNFSNLSDVENIEFHRYADLFPMMQADEFSSLVENIKQHGLREKVWLFQGKILDGRNRYKACLQSGVTPEFRQFTGDENQALQAVISWNLERRHLSSSQKAAIGVELEDLLAELERQAKERQKESIKFRDEKGRAIPVVQKIEQLDEDPMATRTISKAATVLGTNRQYVSDAKKLRQTSPDVHQQIKEGKVTISQAKKQQKQLEREEAVAKQVAVSPVGKPSLEVADAIEWLSRQEPADLLLTDPPYSTDVEDIVDFAASWLPLALSKVKPTGRAFICIGAYPEELHTYLSVAMPDQVLVWTYRNTLGPTPSHRYKLNWQAILYYVGKDAPPLDSPVMVEQFSVQDISAPDGRQGDRYHEWQKPLELANRFIRHCTRPGDTVIDPFACTGTFLISASKLGRVGLGCDASIENLKIAEARGCYVKF